MTRTSTPDVFPVLSRGRHRSPRKGACFMELASYLAGERWSDHPACTHPVLAALAREVNDRVGDPVRTQLAPLVLEVIGLTTQDRHLEVSLSAWIAQEAALTALPVLPADKQRVAALALLTTDRYLAAAASRGARPAAVETALADVPDARTWAQEFRGKVPGRAEDFSDRSAVAIVHVAVSGIADTGNAAAEAMLVDLLTRAVAGCRDLLGQPPARESAKTDRRWTELSHLVR